MVHEQWNERSETTNISSEVDNNGAAQRVKLPKIIRFESLVRCGDEVWIEHAGQIYRLRRTRQGKLILTK